LERGGGAGGLASATAGDGDQLVVVVLQVYRLGRLLFDPSVALLAATITFGTELLWRFVYSGLSTMWLLVLVLFLARLLVAWERGLPTPEPTSGRRQTLLALLIGATLGVMFLTRYSTGLLLVPALAFIVWLGGARRWRSAAAVFLAFTVLVTPWLYRNWRLCGQPFGTAGYALFATTESFPEDKLARSFQPAAGELHLKEVVNKVVTNSLDLLENDLPRFGGNWLAAFFLVGLLVPFQNASLQRLRWFVLASLVLLFLGQAAGRTHFDTLTPTVNPGNLLVLLTPLVFLFGAAFFGLVLDNVPFPFPLLRSLAQLGATLLLCLPLVVALGSDLLAIPGLIPRREYPLAEPYSPTVIRELSSYTPEGSLIVSDVPWAVAWYGGRTSAWIPLHVQDGYKEDFFVLNDYQRPVQALYLSPLTSNLPWHKSFFETSEDHSWFRFMLDLTLRRSLPDNFPLKAIPKGYLEFGHLFLAQKPWWQKP
jgi:Dolichyl-phosphate-mannose-protein mannosyltransferase